MKPNILKISRQAEKQAALWAARLDGGALSAVARESLEAWLAEDPAHRAVLAQYCQLSADLEQQLPELVAAGAVALPRETRRLARFRGWRAVAGVALAAAAAVVFVFWTPGPRTQFENVATPLAQRQTLTLADGSNVELNAHTTLRVEITRDERRARLAAGEALFAVKPDSARPFIVETPGGSVRVTGTVFGVRTSGADGLEVLVVEGSVQVRPQEAGEGVNPVALVAGNKLSADGAGVTVQTLSAAAMEDALAWRQGQIVFDGVPLREALAQFARFHGRGISATPNAAELRVGGRFSLDDLDAFFAALEQALPVRVNRGLSDTVQVSLRTEG